LTIRLNRLIKLAKNLCVASFATLPIKNKPQRSSSTQSQSVRKMFINKTELKTLPINLFPIKKTSLNEGKTCLMVMEQTTVK